ncbi:TonB-dependent Receptor Plug Domain [Hymenobacter daecheongensis DSM 21074]|uniref:TonB-dependent Receptor Plug Domain n=1 Tax=Hymenobacter daecheongensis DSM 21074 TaxID=1121955 RepID=A0A1M6IN86_9BACT|nr:carboxypeptidase-like regulatory domain-containing protein [Hymenobacter daecheongensis]SHJ35892.1 TonB-dependent Receptor Plug Domain [Hymenobacter daecheongensis DSM 21074]
MYKLYRCLLPLLCLLLSGPALWAQNAISISGVVQTEAGEPLPGATVFIKGTFIGSSTDRDGKFVLKADFTEPPVIISVSFVGYETRELGVSQAKQEVRVVLPVSTNLTNAVVVSASRVAETITKVPVTIEKVNTRQVESLTTPDLLAGLARFRAVDVSSSSLLTSSISTRGFNSSRSERVIQMADYMDTQLPSLSNNFGNLLGIPDLDVESIEIVHGPASALYGANAFNGVILFNSKDPFVSEGLSVRLRGGNRDLLDGQLRYAKKLTDRLAFKLTGGALTAKDWLADNQDPTSVLIEPNNHAANSNLGYDAVSRYGDIGTTFGPSGGALNGQTVFLPGYSEKELIVGNQKAHIYKINPSVSYLLTDNVKATVDYKFTNSNTIFQGASRYRFENSGSHQGRAEVKGTNWFVRGYTTQDYSGKRDPSTDGSYNLGFLGGFLQTQVVPGFTVPVNPADPAGARRPGTYAERYFGTYAQIYNGAFLTNGRNAEAAAATARAYANANAPQLQPGTPEFDAARDKIIHDGTPGKGARIILRSIMNDVSAQYNFKLSFADLILGGAYRKFRLGSDGSLFSDTKDGNRLQNHEYGGYAQLTKSLLAERLKLSVAGRVDEFKNFAPAFSPRASVVYSMGSENQQNFRASYNRAFRAATQTDQYIRLDVGRAVLLGNITNGFDGYTLRGAPFRADKLRLEQVNTAEVGYRAQIASKVSLDVDYFRSSYDDFIGTQTFIGNPDGTRPTTPSSTPSAANPNVRVLQISANVKQKVKTQGASLGLGYTVGTPLVLSANYSFNDLISKDLPEGFQAFFNTPRHKYNFGLSGLALSRKLGYTVNYRWTDSFIYESTFATGRVAAYHTIDAQAGYNITALRTTLQAGVSNLLDAGNVQTYGSAGIGRMGYVGLLFDIK